MYLGLCNSEFSALYLEMFSTIVSDGTADVVDVVYVNIVTWSVGCVWLGEAAKGEQSIANQGQEWTGIQESWFSK
jgi:hypothetical protein